MEDLPLLDDTEHLKFKLTNQSAYDWLTMDISGINCENTQSHFNIEYKSKNWHQTPGTFHFITRDKTRGANEICKGALFDNKRWFAIHHYATRFKIFDNDTIPTNDPWIALLLADPHPKNGFVGYRRFKSEDEAVDFIQNFRNAVISLKEWNKHFYIRA